MRAIKKPAIDAESLRHRTALAVLVYAGFRRSGCGGRLGRALDLLAHRVVRHRAFELLGILHRADSRIAVRELLEILLYEQQTDPERVRIRHIEPARVALRRREHLLERLELRDRFGVDAAQRSRPRAAQLQANPP